MLPLITIGVYSRDGAFGVWGQVKLDVAGRPVTIDVQITEPSFATAEAANALAGDCYAQLNPDAEFLPF